MQDEISSQTIGVFFKATELTGETLMQITKSLSQFIKERRSIGKQKVKTLQKKGTKLETVPLDNADLRAFKRAAKMCGLDFAVLKGVDGFTAFYKGKDANIMEAAIQKLTEMKLYPKETIADKLKKAQQKVVQHQKKEKVRSNVKKEATR